MDEFDYKVYWNKRLKGNFGLEAVGYIGLGRNFNRWMYCLRDKVFLHYVKRLKIDFNKSEILDVGCGSGFYISIWRKLNAKKITGIDISKQSITNLRTRFPDNNFEEIDITSDSFPRKKYNIISCMDVLFHVVDEKRFECAMANLSNALFKGAYLIISDNFLNQEQKHSQHHINRTLVAYETILKAHGLKIITRRPAFYFLNFPVDSNNPLLHLIWKIFLRYIPGREYLGNIAGMIFYPIDRMLVFLLTEGPSSEILICEKQ